MFLILKIKCKESKWDGLIRPNHDNRIALPICERTNKKWAFNVFLIDCEGEIIGRDGEFI